MIDSDRSTDLYKMARNWHKDVTVLPMDKGADLTTIDSEEWITDSEGRIALHQVASNGHNKVVVLLLHENSKVDAQNKDKGWTTLYLAVSYGYRKMVELLLNRGSNNNMQNTREWTALHHAVWSDHKDVIELLVNRSTNITGQESEEEQTALHYATKEGKRMRSSWYWTGAPTLPCKTEQNGLHCTMLLKKATRMWLNWS